MSFPIIVVSHKSDCMSALRPVTQLVAPTNLYAVMITRKHPTTTIVFNESTIIL